MSFKVKAREKGYYGFKIRKPGEVFHIEKKSEYGQWMVPMGWTAERPSRSPVDPNATGDAKLLGFKGSKSKYIEDDIEIDLVDAMNRACDDAGLSVAEWNALDEKQRRAYTATAVRLLMEEEAALRAEEDAEGDEGDGSEDDGDDDKD